MVTVIVNIIDPEKFIQTFLEQSEHTLFAFSSSFLALCLALSLCLSVSLSLSLSLSISVGLRKRE